MSGFRTWPLWRSVLVLAVSVVGLAAAGAGGWAGYLRLTGNVHEIEAGRAYRSGQLSPSQLEALLHDKQIRTVINLRGENAGRPWYDGEVAVTRAAGARHVSLPMSANVEPNETLLAALIEVLGSAERPLLIHCEAGADRSGLASALYSLLNMRRPAAEADGQLSFRYGHFPWLTSRTGAMDRTFWRVASQVAHRPASPGAAREPK